MDCFEELKKYLNAISNGDKKYSLVLSDEGNESRYTLLENRSFPFYPVRFRTPLGETYKDAHAALTDYFNDKYMKFVLCSLCDGSGLIWNYGAYWSLCPDCDGKGKANADKGD